VHLLAAGSSGPLTGKDEAAADNVTRPRKGADGSLGGFWVMTSACRFYLALDGHGRAGRRAGRAFARTRRGQCGPAQARMRTARGPGPTTEGEA